MSRLPGHARRIVMAVVSQVLQYPDEGLLEGLPALRDALGALPAAPREPLAAVVGHLGGSPLLELQTAYVATFDLRRRNALYLTYHLNGDTRRRGMAIWGFGELYRSRGYALRAGELADYLPAVLELAAERPADDAGVTDAIAAHLPLELALPEPSQTALDAVERLVAEGPPAEAVGLDPYAIPGTEARP